MITKSKSGTGNGRTSNKHRQEHLISTLLHNKGINRKSLRLRLGIKSPQYYGKCMLKPSEYLTIDQVEIIAGVLELSFLEVVSLIRGAATNKAGKWYDQDHPATLQVAEPAPTYTAK